MRYAMGDSRIKDVSTLLSAFFDADKLKKGERYSDFFSSWYELVGSRLAAHSRVADVDKGFLVIEAEHPGWIQLLQIRQSIILSDISRRYPELALRGIVFRLSGKGSAAGQAAVSLAERSREKAASETRAVEEAIVEEGIMRAQELAQEGKAEGIEDPEFQAMIKSLKITMQGKE
jgi:hypothetical protein